MCDYSLHGVSSRPAKVGDKLVTTQFWNTSTRGFSAADEPRLAVCLLPGTEVAFENKVERHLTGFQLFLRRTKVLPHGVARFRQVNMDSPCTHHDALEFSDGQVVLHHASPCRSAGDRVAAPGPFKEGGCGAASNAS